MKICTQKTGNLAIAGTCTAYLHQLRVFASATKWSEAIQRTSIFVAYSVNNN